MFFILKRFHIQIGLVMTYERLEVEKLCQKSIMNKLCDYCQLDIGALWFGSKVLDKVTMEKEGFSINVDKSGSRPFWPFSENSCNKGAPIVRWFHWSRW